MRLFAKTESDNAADSYRTRCLKLLKTSRGTEKLRAELEARAAELEARLSAGEDHLRTFTNESKKAVHQNRPDAQQREAEHQARVSAESARLGLPPLKLAIDLCQRQLSNIGHVHSTLERHEAMNELIPARIAADLKAARKACDEATKTVADRTARCDAVQREAAGVQTRIDALAGETERRQAPQREALESAKQALAAAIESGDIAAVEELAQRVQELESTFAAPKGDALIIALQAALKARESELERAQAAAKNAQLELAQAERRAAALVLDAAALELVRATIAHWRLDDAVAELGGHAERGTTPPIRFMNAEHSPTGQSDLSRFAMYDLVYPPLADGTLFEQEALT